MSGAENKIREARVGLVIGAPFYASLALHLKPKEDWNCATAYTDTVVFGYNPAFIDSLSVAEVKALLAHEVLHIALEHAFRQGGREHFKWNVASDHAINWVLCQENYRLPDGGLLDVRYRGKSAEEIYDLLPDGELPQPQPCPWQKTNEGHNQGKGQYVPGMTGEVRPYRENPAAPAYAKSNAEQQGEWRVKTAQAVQVAKAQGGFPGGLERMVTKTIQPRLPWANILARFVTEAGRNDYSWKRPSPRYLHSGLYLPALDSPSLDRIVVAVDTSGSVSEAELSRYAAEVRSVLSIYPDAEVHVIYADSKVAGHEVLSACDFELHPRGGGGTSYIPAFAFVDEQDIDPACLVYFTDGCCHRFPEAPKYPVLWVIDGHASFEPPFGEVARINS